MAEIGLRHRSGNVRQVSSNKYRPVIAAALAAVLCVSSLALASCSKSSSDPKPSASASSSSAPASASASAKASASPTKKPTMVTNLDQLKVSGEDGKAPKIEGSWPLAIAKTESKVLKAGKGEKVDKDATVKMNYVGVNGRTGKEFDSSYKRGATTDLPLAQVVPGFAKGLVGKHQGDRVLIMMPGSDAYDSQGGAPQAGIMKGDSLVFVVDIVGVPLPKTTGEPVKPASGLPTVKETQGAPAVTIGKATKPNKLVIQPLIKGKGPVVTANDAIDVKYRTYAWSSGELIEDGYSGEPVAGSMSSVIPGWKKGLTGQTVGSRVMLIVPPADAYPNGSTNPPVKKGETLVYVIDILSAQKES